MADISDAGPAAAAAAAAAASYKQLKEEFVSNLSGGTAGEVFVVTAVAPIAAFTWSVLQRQRSFFRPYSPLAFVVDFLLNAAAILLAITLYSDRPVFLSSLLVAQALFVLAVPKHAAGRRHRVPKIPPHQPDASTPAPSAFAPPLPPPKRAAAAAGNLSALPKKPFLTAYRGCMLVVTCLAILAVDFRIFPRRFAKVETWGTSLMDMGVGSFVFSAGVVAARPVLKERIQGRRTPLARRLLTSLRHSLPLLVLGVIRLLSVKGLDYAEHVTEYGVHWNFFFTLGLLPPFVAVSQSALRLIPSHAVLALALSGLYQVALETTDLKAFILTAPRVDLLSKNREGVFSFIGYLSIFLAGQHLGLYILPRGSVWGRGSSDNNQAAASSWLRRIKLGSLPVWTAIWYVLWQLSVDYRFGLGLTESRRLANLPYVLWVLSFNTLQLSLFALVDTVVFPAFYEAKNAAAEAAAYRDATSPVLDVYNRNGLAVFLLANLLTGLVNLTVPTLDVGPAVSIGILVGYAMALTLVAVALDKWDITIKL